MKEPSMSYNTQAALAVDGDLRNRVAACAATQGVPSPVQWADAHLWSLSGAPGWDGAYAYALATGNPRPGYDEGVITDGMILAAVQPLVPKNLAPAP
jgi:hypothetical protein